jgi:hypothetical protein
MSAIRLFAAVPCAKIGKYVLTFVEASAFCSTATVFSWDETSSIVLGRLYV